jgi:hypothetical protein
MMALAAEIADTQVMRGEKIYEYDLNITGVTDYGVTMDALLSGKEKIPPQGARFDVAFAGPVKGRVTGSVHGVDYLRMRADGRIDLISGPPSKLTTGTGLAFPPTASRCHARVSRLPTYLRMCGLSPLLRATRRSSHVRPGA